MLLMLRVESEDVSSVLCLHAAAEYGRRQSRGGTDDLSYPREPARSGQQPGECWEALGAERVLISVLLIRSTGAFRATGEESTPLKAY